MMRLLLHGILPVNHDGGADSNHISHASVVVVDVLVLVVDVLVLVVVVLVLVLVVEVDVEVVKTSWMP